MMMIIKRFQSQRVYCPPFQVVIRFSFCKILSCNQFFFKFTVMQNSSLTTCSITDAVESARAVNPPIPRV